MNDFFNFGEPDLIEQEVQKYKPTIFDIIKYLTYIKKPWSELTDDEKKVVDAWQLANWFSHIPQLCIGINEIQHQLLSLNKQYVYEFYLNILPKQNLKLRWVSGKQNKELNTIISVIANVYSLSHKNARSQVEFMIKLNKLNELKQIVSMYGLENKVEKKILNYINTL